MQNQFYPGQRPFHATNTSQEPFPSQAFPQFPFAPSNTDPRQMDGSGVPFPVASSDDDADSPSLWSKRRKPFIIGGSIIGLVIIVLSFIITQFVLKSSANVTLYQVSVQNVTQYVGGGGIVYPRQQFVMSYPVAEQAMDVLVNAGDTVSANQPLIKLDTTKLNIEVQQAADDVAAAQAYLDSVAAGGNPVTIAQAQRQYDLAESKYNALVAQSSSLTLHNGNLVSPLSGVVTEVDIDSGEVFTADTPLLTIMDESSVIVHTKIPLADLQQVHIGQSADVTPSALPDINLTGHVVSIIPQADPQTDTFEVWVEVPNRDKSLLPGMSAFVRIQSSGQAIVVPRLAVLNPDRDSAVFVVRNQHAYLEHVHVSGRSEDTIYIDAGLSNGDDVVLIGLYQLSNGQQVNVKLIEK